MPRRTRGQLLIALSLLCGLVALSTGGPYSIDTAFASANERATRPPETPAEQRLMMDTTLAGVRSRSKTEQALLLLDYHDKRLALATDEIGRARISIVALVLAGLSALVGALLFYSSRVDISQAN